MSIEEIQGERFPDNSGDPPSEPLPTGGDDDDDDEEYSERCDSVYALRLFKKNEYGIIDNRTRNK